MRTSALFGEKPGFFEIDGVSARTRGEEVWAGADVLQTRGRRSIFCDFVRTSFMDGPFSLLSF